MSDLALAGRLACIDIYDPIAPGVFNRIYREGESVVGTAINGLYFDIIHQGTELTENGRPSLDGWEADFDCAPVYHAVLGNLHSGFNRNIDPLIAQIAPNIPTGFTVRVQGHSKGAGEGSIMAAKLKLAGFNVADPILFACPNSMYQRGADWYAANFPGAISLRNVSREIEVLGDPVPLVPLHPYVAPVKHALVCVPPKGLAAMIPTNWHHGGLYNAAVMNL